MTLRTDIYVMDPIDARAVFHHVNKLIGANDCTKWSDRQDKTWRNGEGFIEPGNEWTISNDPDQGLPAWLIVSYRPDVPLRTPEQSAEHDEWCDKDCDGEYHPQPCWLTVDLDTAYAYKVNGEGCGDLHARLIAELGSWLAHRGISWRWRNEFSGDIYDGYDGLETLARAGIEAAHWYRNIVLPAIAPELALSTSNTEENQ